MVQGILVLGVVLMRRPWWEVGHRWKKILVLEAVNFRFPSVITIQNKAGYTSEYALMQDPKEIIRIYITRKQGLDEKANTWNGKENNVMNNRTR